MATNIGAYYIVAPDGRVVAKSDGAEMPIGDALLIASAPDLLEALDAIEYAICAGLSPAEVLDENSPLRDAARNAIAKARWNPV